MKRRTLVPVICLLSACQVVGNYQRFDANEEPSSPCRNLPATKNDDRNITLMARVDITDGACVWMDTTEVTVENYQSWLENAAADATNWDRDWCRWKDQREDPRTSTSDAVQACRDALDAHDVPPFEAKKPIRCVDWCEAEAYCRWAGKRLCFDYGLSGVQVPRDKPREWREACTNAQTTTYPWGNLPENGRCNAARLRDTCQLAGSSCVAYTVGAWSGCRTKAGTISDLIGNVAEWVYSCIPQDPEQANLPTGCLTLGGSFKAELQSCQGETTLSNDSRLPDVGFRCCDDLTNEELGKLIQ